MPAIGHWLAEPQAMDRSACETSVPIIAFTPSSMMEFVSQKPPGHLVLVPSPVPVQSVGFLN
jgi:hypothetical protein